MHISATWEVDLLKEELNKKDIEIWQLKWELDHLKAGNTCDCARKETDAGTIRTTNPSCPKHGWKK